MQTHATFSCRGCAQELQVPVEWLPIDGPCPECGAPNRVERSEAAESSNPTTGNRSAGPISRALHIGSALALALLIGGAACVYVSRKLEQKHAEILAAPGEIHSESTQLPTTRKDGVVMVRMEESEGEAVQAESKP